MMIANIKSKRNAVIDAAMEIISVVESFIGDAASCGVGVGVADGIFSIIMIVCVVCFVSQLVKVITKIGGLVKHRKSCFRICRIGPCF